MTTYHVRIGEKEYSVEITNPHERPVKALVDGEPVEVWIESGGEREDVAPQAARKATPQPVAPAASAAVPSAEAGVITAPLPGVVVSIAVKEGDFVEPGMEVCVLEAMKMNNPIRSVVAGTVKAVHVTVGQQVQYGAPLITLA